MSSDGHDGYATMSTAVMSRHEGATVLERPWARVEDPTPIPDGVEAEDMVALESTEFAALVRDNLIPRNGPGDRERWAALWSVLAADDDLSDRTLDVLEDFEEAIETMRSEAGTDERELKRARRFATQVDIAADRLERRAPAAGPLVWLGARARKFNDPGRKVIDQLVTAIANHRATVGAAQSTRADRELWAVLEQLRMDPGPVP